jgi:hypothetical protein
MAHRSDQNMTTCHLSLAKRARKHLSHTAQIRSWTSQDRRYGIVEVLSLLDGHRSFLAVETLPNGNQMILSRHRKRTPAIQSLERVARGRW